MEYDLNGGWLVRGNGMVLSLASLGSLVVLGLCLVPCAVEGEEEKLRGVHPVCVYRCSLLSHVIGVQPRSC